MGGYRLADPATSQAAYEKMSADGTLSRSRLEIAQFLAYSNGEITAGMIAYELKRNRNNVATRLSELERLGVAAKGVERTCPISNKQCWTWHLTGKQPLKKMPDSPKSTITQHRTAVKEFNELCANIARWADGANLPNLAERVRLRSAQIMEKIQKC